MPVRKVPHSPHGIVYATRRPPIEKITLLRVIPAMTLQNGHIDINLVVHVTTQV